MKHALLVLAVGFACGLLYAAISEWIEGSPIHPLCRLGFHRWGKPYEPMDNGYMECCTRPHCDALHEVITDPDGAL